MNGDGPHAEAEAGTEHESGADEEEELPYREDIPGVGEQPSLPLSADDDRSSRRRRRGRRGGRRGRDRDGAPGQNGSLAAHNDDAPTGHSSSDNEIIETPDGRPQYAGSPNDETPQSVPAEATGEHAIREEARATNTRRRRAAPVEEAPSFPAGYGTRDQPVSPEASAPVSEPASRDTDRVEVIEDDPSRPTRKGWWQRRFSTD